LVYFALTRFNKAPYLVFCGPREFLLITALLLTLVGYELIYFICAH